MAKVAIRECVPDDAGAVERLRVAGWQTAYRGMVPDAFLDSMPVDAERRRATMTSRTVLVIESVAVQAGVIVGWIAAGPGRGDDTAGPGHGEIYACYVLPERWGTGVGRLLLTHATTALAAAGRDDIVLWVLEENGRARKFYESQGFRPDGRCQRLDLGAPVSEVRYRRQRAPGRGSGVA